MLIKLDEQTTANAARRNRAPGVRLRARRTKHDREIAVSCMSGDHPTGHLCRYKYIKNVLWGECVLPETGEECPSAIGKRVCAHLTAGVVQLRINEASREAGIHATNQRISQRARADENQPLMMGDCGGRVEKYNGIPL